MRDVRNWDDLQVRPTIYRSLVMRRSGRYCWSCGCRRPNERFSRRSSQRGVCRECYRLGPAELAFRQVAANIDRALCHGELIPKRHRNVIESALQHGDQRVREYAAAVIARDIQVRRELAEVYRDADPVPETPPADLIDVEDIPF